ncbi:gamma-glutamyltransferase [Pseudomonadota bacterium]
MRNLTHQTGGPLFLKQLFAATAGPLVLLLLFVASIITPAQAGSPSASAVASAHPTATAAGHEILAAGGNAFDAAVAISATLAVVEPAGSGIGGGGFWLLHRAKDGYETMVDGRERTPLQGHRDMYLDESGNVIRGLSMNGPLAAGIPGEPAALVHIAKKYGRLPLKQSLTPAIRAAREGFAVDEHYRKRAGFRLKVMQQDTETARIFLLNNEVPPVGHIVKQPDLASTLEKIASEGRKGFYQGSVAKKLVDGVRKAGGIWSLEDLKAYRAIERQPIRGEYKGIQVVSAPPPSSGGTALVEMLNILSAYDLENMDDTSRTHVIVEAMRRAYRDRAEYLGDPDFVDVPTKGLTHPYYADTLRKSIQLNRATPSSELKHSPILQEGEDTTHFSVIDEEGNRVAATLSVNYPFGAAFVPAGTGVLLNDEMDDFSAKPGIPNAYGLVGAEANAIAPGKRPLSSMTPTFLETEEKLAILGTPGGSRIITMVLLGALEFAANKPPQAWVSVPRFHHQYLPDSIQIESDSMSTEQQEALRAKGHTLKQLNRTYGNMQAILWDKKTSQVSAASDPRGGGEAAVITHLKKGLSHQ